MLHKRLQYRVMAVEVIFKSLQKIIRQLQKDPNGELTQSDKALTISSSFELKPFMDVKGIVVGMLFLYVNKTNKQKFNF